MIVLFTILLGNLFASGYQINENGTRAFGMGNAFTAVADDASAIHFNPAGMAFIDGSDLTVGVTLIKPVITFRGPAPENTEYETKERVFTPINLYYTSRINENWSAGFGINNPYGMATNWEDDWVGKYMAVETSLETAYATAALAYKVNDRFSISAGPVAAYGVVEMRKMQNLTPFDGIAEIELKGDDLAWGFTAGIFYKASDKVSFGLSYRSQVDFEFEGEVESEAPEQFAGRVPNCDISADMSAPKNITFGCAYNPIPTWTISADFQYVGWASYDELVIEFDDSSFENTVAAREYNNTYIVRLGTEYMATELMALRGGIFFDHSPVKDEYVEPSLPDASRIGFNCGLGYEFVENFTFDFGYLFLRGEEREITDSHESYTDGEAPFNGVYNTYVNAISFNLSYKF